MTLGLMKLLLCEEPLDGGLPIASLNQGAVAFWQNDLDPLSLESHIKVNKAQILCFFVSQYEVPGLQYLGELCREWSIYPLPIVTHQTQDIHKIAETDLSDVLVCSAFDGVHSLNNVCVSIPKGFRKYLNIPDLNEKDRRTALVFGKKLGFCCYLEM